MTNPLEPLMKDGEVTFAEPWHAQVMAIADTMVRQGKIGASDWADALGAERAAAENAGQGDDPDTYYANVLTALEKLCQRHDLLSPEDLTKRRSDWEAAYLRTPHGQPVTLNQSNTDAS